jgi:hypothetical protein
MATTLEGFKSQLGEGRREIEKLQQSLATAKRRERKLKRRCETAESGGGGGGDVEAQLPKRQCTAAAMRGSGGDGGVGEGASSSASSQVELTHAERLERLMTGGAGKKKPADGEGDRAAGREWATTPMVSPCLRHTREGLGRGLTRLWWSPGAGGDNGIVHDKKWLRFPYVLIFLRCLYLHPHPAIHCRAQQPPCTSRAPSWRAATHSPPPPRPPPPPRTAPWRCHRRHRRLRRRRRRGRRASTLGWCRSRLREGPRRSASTDTSAAPRWWAPRAWKGQAGTSWPNLRRRRRRRRRRAQQFTTASRTHRLRCSRSRRGHGSAALAPPTHRRCAA